MLYLLIFVSTTLLGGGIMADIPFAAFLGIGGLIGSFLAIWLDG